MLAKSPRLENNLVRFGFRLGRGGAHLARSMMLDDLRRLLDHVPDPRADRHDFARDAVLRSSSPFIQRMTPGEPLVETKYTKLLDAGPERCMELAEQASRRGWIVCNRIGTVIEVLFPQLLTAEDGLVCIPAVRGEPAAADRLLNLLAKSYGSAWSNETLGRLLKDAGYAGKTLETWLRDGFFAQHCELFHQRPFIWQIWDGLRDGFSILVNYHRLDRKNLETLIYTYLGDWIARQKQDEAAKVDGAAEKIAAAVALQKKLELIRDGQSPYDIFVRWKPLQQQPIGWEPDLNDGVRLNIRPFLTVPDVKTKGAGVLRAKPKIKWEKDRGKEPERPKDEFPWFWGWDGTDDFLGGPAFTGDRFNNCHYTLRTNTAARERVLQKT